MFSRGRAPDLCILVRMVLAECSILSEATQVGTVQCASTSCTAIEEEATAVQMPSRHAFPMRREEKSMTRREAPHRSTKDEIMSSAFP